jgi:hypothetical protein
MMVTLSLGCEQTPNREVPVTGVLSPSNEALALLSLTDGEVTEETLVVVDQVLLTVAEGTADDDVDGLLDRVDGEHPDWGLTHVGTVEMIRLRQLAFDNLGRAADEQAARLQAVIARFESEPFVTAAAPNRLMSTFFLVEDDSDDNTILINQERCAYAAVDYYQAYAVFQEILPHVQLNDVTVAIVDTGIDLTTREFDDIAPRLQLITPASPVRSASSGHGTAVAGIIAADIDGEGVNGLALPFLGDRLSIQFVFLDPYTYEEIAALLPGQEVSEDFALAPLGNMLAGVTAAVTSGADIVNLSLGLARADGAPPVYIRSIRQMWWDTVTHPDARNTLFVAAAPNHNIALTGQNTVPAGLTNPAGGARPDNLLTVGGVDSCNPTHRWSSSAHGDLVEAAAPATGVHAVRNNSARYAPVNGNSFAAPMVSAIAAIAHSVDPGTLRGAALKNLLISDPASLPVEPPFEAVRPTLMFSAGRAILAHARSSPEVDRILDSLGGRADGFPDPTGWVSNRAFGRSELTVTGPGYNSHNDISGEDALLQAMTGTNAGVLGAGFFDLNLSAGSDVLALVVVAPFRLRHPYTIGMEAEAKLWAGGVGGDFISLDESGTVTLTDCELTTRSLPLDHFLSPVSGPFDELVFIQLQGNATGTVVGDINSSPPQLDVTYQFSASFETAFMLWSPPAAWMTLWEQQCAGGFGP